LICRNALNQAPGCIFRLILILAAALDLIQEQILIYRLLIADIERRHPEMVKNMNDIADGPNPDELQRLLTYRSSLKTLERFTEEDKPASNQ
jgi:hypothetical protein